MYLWGTVSTVHFLCCHVIVICQTSYSSVDIFYYSLQENKVSFERNTFLIGYINNPGPFSAHVIGQLTVGAYTIGLLIVVIKLFNIYWWSCSQRDESLFKVGVWTFSFGNGPKFSYTSSKSRKVSAINYYSGFALVIIIRLNFPRFFRGITNTCQQCVV